MNRNLIAIATARFYKLVVETMSLEKRVSLALTMSICMHALLLALLVWRGGVFSPAGLVSGPVELVETTVQAQSALKTPRPRRAKTARVIRKDELGLPTIKSEEPQPAASSTTAVSPSDAQSGSAIASDPNEMARYVGLLVLAVQKNRRYPKEAIDREEEGVVALTVRLKSDGELLEAAVKKPSPFTSLNEAALKTVQTIRHFPKPPIVEGTVIELVIPMRFKIERL
jgi:periplasmic protein TonB